MTFFRGGLIAKTSLPALAVKPRRERPPSAEQTAQLITQPRRSRWQRLTGRIDSVSLR